MNTTAGSNALNQYTALVVDPSGESRIRLKQAALALIQFGDIRQASKLSQASTIINHDNVFDIIFVSHSFEQSRVTEFIQDCKSKKQCQDTAFVVLMPTMEGSTSSLADEIVDGADGFLLEPFCVNGLLEISELADRIKLLREAERRRGAMEILIQESAKHLDAVARREAQGLNSALFKQDFRQAAAAFSEFTEVEQEVYFKALLKIFTKTEVPEEISEKKRARGRQVRKSKIMAQQAKEEVASEEEAKEASEQPEEQKMNKTGGYFRYRKS